MELCNFVLLSNIYAKEGKWDDVEMVRMLMREKSFNKSPDQGAIGQLHHAGSIKKHLLLIHILTIQCSPG